MDHNFLLYSKVYFFDLDGCVYHGDRLSPGIIQLLDQLRQRGIYYAFLTNNSRLNAAEIGERLASLGLDVPPSSILTVTDIAGTYIKDKYGYVTVKAIGSDSLVRSIEEAGLRTVAWDGPAADILIVGRDTEFHYAKLQQIATDVIRGSRIIAANPDYYHPGAFGERIPETGSLLAAIEAVTNITAECIGKPEPYMFLYGMKQYGVDHGSCVMVGDNPETDILGSKRAGLKSVWITNGTEDDNTVWKQEWGMDRFRPDVVVKSIEGLYRLIAAGMLETNQ